MNTLSPLDEAIDIIGITYLSRSLAVSPQAVYKWKRAGHMPRTEWWGGTHYASSIEKLTEGRVTKEALLGAWPTPVPTEQGAD